MRWFRDLSLRWKLQLGFGVISMLVAVMGVLGFLALGSMQSQCDSLFERRAAGLAYLKEAAIQSLDITRDLQKAVLDDSPEKLDERVARISEHDRDFRRAFDAYCSRVKQPRNKALSAQALASYDEAWKMDGEVLELLRQNKEPEARARLAAAGNLLGQMDDLLGKLQKEKLDDMLKGAKETARLGEASRFRLTANGLLIIALSIVIGAIMAHGVTRSLRNVVRKAECAAEGDFAVRVDPDSNDELGQMGRALDAMLERFETSIAQVRDADQRAGHTREGAERGGPVVREAVTSMASLSRASRRIAEIGTTIDEIAFQTNLLALNASVEAARAGEQGRGFAVVAGEVRNLAQRAAGASREIRALVDDSTARVEQSTVLVNRASETLDAIVNDVRAVADLVGDISVSSREQATGIGQVNHAITQLDQVRWGKAARTQELTTTAQTLAEQADCLRAQVAQFHVPGDPAMQRLLAG